MNWNLKSECEDVVERLRDAGLSSWNDAGSDLDGMKKCAYSISVCLLVSFNKGPRGCNFYPHLFVINK